MPKTYKLRCTRDHFLYTESIPLHPEGRLRFITAGVKKLSPIKNKDLKEQIIQNVHIVDIADKGMSIGKDPEGRVLMVEKLIPGDRADVKVFKKRKGMKYAAPHRMIEWSEHRRDAFCEHFGVCGGCKWQHMDYQAQLHYKEQNVLNAMKRIAKVEIPDIRPILGSSSDRYYRNKMEYSFSNKRWLTEEEIVDQDAILEKNALGFHRPGAFDKVVDIERCYLQDEFANEIRNAVRDFALDRGYSFFDLKAQEGLLRNLLIRNTTLGEWMVVVHLNLYVLGITLLLPSSGRYFVSVWKKPS